MTTGHEDGPNPSATAVAGAEIGESRWPMAIAVLVLMAAALIAPARLSIVPGWILAALEGLLLLALILGDPGRIDRTGPWQRRTSIALVVVILAGHIRSDCPSPVRPPDGISHHQPG